MCVYECVYADLLFASLNPFNVNYIKHFRKKKRHGKYLLDDSF